MLLLWSTPVSAKFFDFDETHPYFDAIQYLTINSIVQGYENRSFQPDRTINRAEFTKILMNAVFPASVSDGCLSALDDAAVNPVLPAFNFPDVPRDAWFAPAICAAWTNGIVDGYPDGRFRPEEGVKFVEAAKMLSLAYGLTGVELPNLGAGYELWYTPYVEFLAAENAIPVGIHDLAQNINRGEMAELIYRLKDAPYALPPVNRASKTTQDVAYPLTWKEYVNEDYTFTFQYPNIWPAPSFLPRGSYDGRSPYVRSEWTVYFGPNKEENCMGQQLCVARDMWIDGYALSDSDAIINAISSDVEFIELEDNVTINGLPTLIVQEEVGDCIDRRAFYFGARWIYVLNVRCGGQDKTLYNFFDQVIQSFEEIDERPPEHRK